MNDESESEERTAVDAHGSEREQNLEAWLSEVRHDLRNRFAAIRNANFYIRKRASKTELLQQDERVRAFFDLIDRELTEADAMVKLITGERVLAPFMPDAVHPERPESLERDQGR
jgi:signal transduction histidine kinase